MHILFNLIFFNLIRQLKNKNFRFKMIILSALHNRFFMLSQKPGEIFYNYEIGNEIKKNDEQTKLYFIR